jgi:hypothetical protein
VIYKVSSKETARPPDDKQEHEEETHLHDDGKSHQH